MDSVFIDTNLLVYTVDDDSPEKQKRARDVIKAVSKRAFPVISTQVLQEFYNASTRKLMVNELTAKSIVHDLCNMTVIQNTPDIIERGIDISITMRKSFWDSLIIAAAEFAGCLMLLSEDMQDNETIQNTTIINPFIHKLDWE